MNSPTASVVRPPFAVFYRDHFLAEHRHPANVALHVAGTLASAVFAIGVPFVASPWWLLAYPVVHAVPGLIGHRLFERNPELGDVRVLRKDFPAWWFIVANHRLTWRVLAGRR